MADYQFQVLSQDEQDDIMTNFLLAQERDLFCHQTSLARYDAMLVSLPDGPFKTRIQGLRTDTQSRIDEVNAIIAASQNQIPPSERLQAAMSRLSSTTPAALKTA